MVEKGRKDRKIGLFQPSKSPKILEKSRQNSPKPRQNDGKTAAKHRRRASSARRGAGPVLYSYVGRRVVAAGVWRAVLLSGAGMMCGRGAAVLSYIAM